MPPESDATDLFYGVNLELSLLQFLAQFVAVSLQLLNLLEGLQRQSLLPLVTRPAHVEAGRERRGETPPGSGENMRSSAVSRVQVPVRLHTETSDRLRNNKTNKHTL